jgi:hypothetical protein
MMRLDDELESSNISVEIPQMANFLENDDQGSSRYALVTKSGVVGVALPSTVMASMYKSVKDMKETN